MLAFEQEKLRDRDYREKFYAKLDEIKEVRQKHTYLAYATNHHLFEELRELYEQNLQAYEDCYHLNEQAYARLKSRARASYQSIHKSRYPELQQLYQDIEQALSAECYEQNAKAQGLIQQLEQQLEGYLSEYVAWQQTLAEMREALKGLKTTVWAEDYAPFRDQYEAQKLALHGKKIPEGGFGFDEQALKQARARKQQAIEQLRKRAGQSQELLKQIASLEAPLSSYESFQQVERAVVKHVRVRQAKWGAMAMAGLGVMVALAIFGPGYYHDYQERAFWKVVEDSNSYEMYARYLARYPSGQFGPQAMKAQKSLDHGFIAERSDREGTFAYEGQLQGGEPHGQGKAEYQSGNVYEGQWVHGLRTGHGTYQVASGARYEGEWLNGLRHGTGTQTWQNGTVYEGQWEADRRQGQGKLIQPLMGTYTGSFVADTMEGQGTFAFENGAKYVGQWKSGRRHGRGVYYFEDGSKYDGNWRQDFREGFGKMRYQDGRVYSGAWRGDQPSGKGSMYWPDGSSFSGQWVNGEINGLGTFTSRMRETFTGRWEKDADGMMLVYDNSGALLKKGHFQDGLFMAEE